MLFLKGRVIDCTGNPSIENGLVIIKDNKIKNTLLAGVKSIEHGIFLEQDCIKLMVQKNAYLVPTLSILYALINKREKLSTTAKSMINTI